MYTFPATIRSCAGKRPSRRLRRKSQLPASVCSKNGQSISLVLNHNEFLSLQNKEDFLEAPIELNINGDKKRVRFLEIQRHPFKNLLLHIEFLEVDV